MQVLIYFSSSSTQVVECHMHNGACLCKKHSSELAIGVVMTIANLKNYIETVLNDIAWLNIAKCYRELYSSTPSR